MTRLAYITDARLPTEKAHGVQICKMCEAFAATTFDVDLIHPDRKQVEPKTAQSSVFEFYGIPSVFSLITTPNWDIGTFVQRFCPGWLGKTVSLINRSWWALKVAVKYRAKYDIYFTREPYVALALAFLRQPVALELHGLPRGGQLQMLHFLRNLSSLRLVVSMTEQLRLKLLEIGFSASQVLTQPDCVDLSDYLNLPAKLDSRVRLGIPAEALTIGYIGQLSTMGQTKGVDTLIKALAQPELLQLNIHLVCIGGPDELSEQYRELALQLGIAESSLTFLKRIPHKDVPKWISVCDVTAVPLGESLFASFYTSPMKLFEYMAGQTAIIASDLPSLKEVLTHNKNAWIVPPSDIESWTKGLLALFSDNKLRQRLAAQAFNDVTQYTWNKRARTIATALKLYEYP